MECARVAFIDGGTPAWKARGFDVERSQWLFARRDQAPAASWGGRRATTNWPN
jgi:hypothetical protein